MNRRILFALNEPGYFRLYGSTIVELTRRGWEVLLAFDNPEKRGGPQVPKGAEASVRSLGALPGNVSPAATALRTGLDYLRYLEPSFAHAHYLRRRAEKNLTPAFRFLTRVRRLPRWVVSTGIAIGRAVERAIPIDVTLLEFVHRLRPAAIVVSPLVIIGESGARQTELIKAGRRLGIRVIVGVASWDHLTSKGLVRIVPDAVTVWNEWQAHEAVALHRIPRSRVITTGAQSLDHWFQDPSPGAMGQFRNALGIAQNERVLLIVGSSRNMAPGDSEVEFVRRWLSAVRTSANPDVRQAFVIVRPHPGNVEPWQDVDLADPKALVHPRAYSGLPLSDAEIETFRRSLLTSDAVIGINTTAMIEAAILRRPVFTVQDAAFEHSQRETLHLTYLASGDVGFLVTASTLSEHVAQLERRFSGETGSLQISDRFVQRFVRPLGTNIPATSHLCDAIELIALAQRETPVTDSPPKFAPFRVRGGRP